MLARKWLRQGHVHISGVSVLRVSARVLRVEIGRSTTIKGRWNAAIHLSKIILHQFIFDHRHQRVDIDQGNLKRHYRSLCA